MDTTSSLAFWQSDYPNLTLSIIYRVLHLACVDCFSQKKTFQMKNSKMLRCQGQ